MFNASARWALFTSISLFAAVYYGVYEGALQAIMATQHPIVTLSLIAAVFINLLYMGHQAVKAPFTPNTEPGFFWSEICMGVALAGSVMGMIQAFQIFKTAASAANIKQTIGAVAAATGTAQITLLTGIMGAIVLRLALVSVFGAYFQKED